MLTLRTALSALAPFTALKAIEPGYHAVRLDGDRLTATNGVDGISVPADLDGVEACVPFVDLKGVVASVPAGTAKLKIKRKRLEVSVAGGSTYTFKLLSPQFAAPAAPDAWQLVNADDVEALRGMATIAKGCDNPAGVRLAATWFGAARQELALVALRATFAPLSEPVTISATIAKTLSGAQEIAYDGARVWFRDVETGVLRWTLPLAATYPDSLGEALIPGALDAIPKRVRCPVQFGSLSSVVTDAKLMSGSEKATAQVQVSDGAIGVRFSTARGSFHGTVTTAGSDTRRAGATIPLAALLFSGLRSIVAPEDAVDFVMCPPAKDQQRQPFLVVTSTGEVGLLAPCLLR